MVLHNEQPIPSDEQPSPLRGAERLLSAQELADYLEVPVKTIYTWRHRSTGPRGFRIGKHLRFQWCDVESWLAKLIAEEG